MITLFGEDGLQSGDGEQLVAQRLENFARHVGRENVIASTDCGLGLRCHAQIAWAKLRALSEGAALASRALWRTAKPARPAPKRARCW